MPHFQAVLLAQQPNDLGQDHRLGEAFGADAKQFRGGRPGERQQHQDGEPT